MIRRIKTNLFVRNCWFLIERARSIFKGKGQFAQCGDNVIITPPYTFNNPKNIYLGPCVGLGAKSNVSAPNARFICKGHCAIAEGLTVHTGNHARVIGMYITDINDDNKPAGYDRDVIVEEDVWIGSNVTLLSGVIVGRGTTVAAGAVVAKSMPPYCICGGVPAKFIKFYWTIDQVIEHESRLYPKEERFAREQLEELYAKWSN